MKKWSVIFAAVWLVSWVLTINAHEAKLIESSPANGALLGEAPEQISARFSEEIVFGESGLVVLNNNGEQVDNGDGGVDLDNPNRDSLLVTLPASLPDGVYTVEWRVMLLDGDVTEGAFTFTVGEPTAVSTNTHPTPSESSTAIAWIASAVGIVLIALLIVTIVRKKVY